MTEAPPRNRRQRRALRSIQGGKPVPPAQVVAPVVPRTPAQQFGHTLEAFVAKHLREHSGLDAMNITKVVMQYSASSAIDFGATREDYLQACGEIFDQEKAARG